MPCSDIPHTRRGRAFAALLAGLWIASIAGLALTLGSFGSRLMDVGFHPGALGWRIAAIHAICLAAWAVIAWVARRGTRRNQVPPAWSILTLVGLVWAAILLNRAG